MKRAASRTYEIEVVVSDRPGLVSCSGKRCYDHKAAKKLAKRMRRNQDKRVEGYHCGYCKAWHIGAIQPKRRELIAKEARNGQVCASE